MKVGFIGLGIMGGSMAANIADKGFALNVYNRTKSRLEPFIKKGIMVSDSPEGVARNSDITIIMVTDAPDVEDVLFGKEGWIHGAKEGKIVVDMGTNSPKYAEEFAGRLSSSGVEFLDAPVTGGDVGAKQGTLTIMVGGKPDVFNSAKPVFEAMGKTIIYAGPSGYGQKMKLVNQIAIGLETVAMVEAMELAKAAGLDIDQVYRLLSTGGARSFTIESYMPRLMKGDIEPGFKAAHLRKDLKYAEELAASLGVPLIGGSLALQLFTALTNTGMGEKGVHALLKLYDGLTKLNEKH
ncbi:MAG: NAD(P)-dependent oxidoreductase [Nitrososphaerota archaeon]|nr:NAD(P)-dependent oxidoreductase [Nitrososphaerota archaeon]MDG6928132.1 NAD(P)-dependent oxidoreductase [Nitrososphaerota archaeon]MDG6929693.1 NAD(P)-dependent oxidoreductase [Nitrososphaerota archaeon]MDG6932867.1 NAD(P)-dependent oxidoreductase [Nitrososphaerota archaeon]MDG6936282.1 NAD(P)-dependent oxidoreductase [Nitrososphaerota archaeon]